MTQHLFNRAGQMREEDFLALFLRIELFTQMNSLYYGYYFKEIL
jgi:hypothetical protein